MDDKKEQLIRIVGKRNVLDDLETLDAYSKDHSFAPPRKPMFVVKPKNADEVQAVVMWANQTGTPLVPVSSGPPHFRGDTVPRVAGAVIIDLSRMKKVIRIDRHNRITIIEPGVTYAQLQPELAKHGMRLSTPLLPRANKSVIASLLEREPTLIPKYQWVLLEPLRCLEVVWGDGSKMWTGEAGEYGSQDLGEQYWKKRAAVTPHGPGSVDYYRLVSAAQGSLGIVTWASVKCEVLPQLHKLFFMPSSRLDNLIDCAYKILRFRLGDELLILNNVDLASILGEGTQHIKALREQLPPWVMLVGVAGRDILPRERVEYQEKSIAAIAQQSAVQFVSAIPGANDDKVLLSSSKEPYWKLGHKGGCQDIFFLTTLDKTLGFIETLFSVAEAVRYPTADLGIYIQPQQQGVCCHCEFSLSFDPGDQKEVARVQDLFTRGSEELLKHGAFFSRPYGIWADMAYSRDAQSTILLKKVKGLFDPNNILNPGRLCFS
jgi:FAD/FMN-containing dehydrogenase